MQQLLTKRQPVRQALGEAAGAGVQRLAAALLACLLAAPGCTWDAGRAWQRNECLRQPTPDAQRRCEEKQTAVRDPHRHPAPG